MRSYKTQFHEIAAEYIAVKQPEAACVHIIAVSH